MARGTFVAIGVYFRTKPNSNLYLCQFIKLFYKEKRFDPSKFLKHCENWGLEIPRAKNGRGIATPHRYLLVSDWIKAMSCNKLFRIVYFI